MLPAVVVERPPRLVRAIARFTARADEEEAVILADELAGITAMVAEKFTNERTAEGIQRAYFLTVGGVSLGLEHLVPGEDDDEALDFLVEQGAEAAFQAGFRLLKELVAMPESAYLNDFLQSPEYVQGRLKSTFFDLCNADPQRNWRGYEDYLKLRGQREEAREVLRAAQWLRSHHSEGPVRDSEIDAEGVIALAIIFAVEGAGRITARAGQKEFERFVASVRKNKPDFAAGWAQLLQQVPPQHRKVIADRIENYREHCTVLQKLRGRSALKTLFAELEGYAGTELEAEAL
jgi:hypothetical protein